MRNKSILLNESFDTTNQQPYNLPNIDINIKNKEYEENNSLHSDKNSSSSNCLKKSDDYDSLKEYKRIFLNQDYPFHTNVNFFPTKNEDKKEEEKEETEERSDRNKMLGRKRKDSQTIGIHNKYSNDNVQKKIKSKLLDILLNFIP